MEGTNSKMTRKAYRELHRKPNLAGAYLAVCLMLFALAFALFIPPFIGLEDNGQYSSVLNASGLYALPQNEAVRYEGYFVKLYGVMQYDRVAETGGFSSMSILIRPLVMLTRMIEGSPAVFDIGTLATFLSLAFLASLFLLLTALTKHLKVGLGLVVGVAAVLAFSDISYIAYFQSFYLQAPALISLTAAVGCMLFALLNRQKKTGWMVGYFACTLIFILLKPALGLAGIGFGLITLIFYLRENTLAQRWLTGAVAVVLVLAGSIHYIAAEKSEIQRHAFLYNALSRGILTVAEDPAETLENLGIDTQYTLLSGSSYYDKYPIIDPEDERMQGDVYNHLNASNIAGYYIAHPKAWMQMYRRTIEKLYGYRPGLGNFTVDAGYAAGTEADILNVYSQFKAGRLPKTVGFVVIWIAVVLVILYHRRDVQLLTLGLMLAAVLSLLIATMGVGDAVFAEAAFLFNACFDLTNLIVFAHIVEFFDRVITARKLRRA